MRRESGDLQTNALGELAVAAGGCFDEELEAAVLGAALLERKALPVVLEKLDAECFYAEGTGWCTGRCATCLRPVCRWMCSR